jgi:acyl-CoA hydrolase
VSPRRITLPKLLDHFRPGARIYIPGATGELTGLAHALEADPGRLAQVELVSCLVPGMNQFDYAALHPDARMTTFLLPPQLRASFEAGRVRVLPLAYSMIAGHLATLGPDVAILHLTPPVDGQCSFGTCADFGPIVMDSAFRLVGVINPLMPRPKYVPTLPYAALDEVLEMPEAAQPVRYPVISPEVLRLADHVAGLVSNGAAVQTGIGAAPDAVWRALKDHRGLRLRSGMVTDGFLQACEAGVMARTGHVAGVAYGDSALLKCLDGSAIVRFGDVRTTHGAASLARVTGLVSINSALEVDLFGQANLEWQSGRLISGVGGAPDFNLAARRSVGDRAVLALPSTAKGGTISRITARLSSPTASLGRAEVDVVVTEHGVAPLAGRSLDERAEALLAITAPQHRRALEVAWTELRRKL